MQMSNGYQAINYPYEDEILQRICYPVGDQGNLLAPQYTCNDGPELDRYWSDADSIGPISVQFCPIVACLQGGSNYILRPMGLTMVS